MKYGGEIQGGPQLAKMLEKQSPRRRKIKIGYVKNLFLHCGQAHRSRACIRATARATLPGRYIVEGEKIMVTLKANPPTPEEPKGSLDFVEVDLIINDVLGKRAEIDGPLIQTITGDASIEVFFDEEKRHTKIKRADKGAWSVVYSGDADLDPGEEEKRPFEIVIQGNNPGLEAVTFEAKIGPVQSEPIA